MTVSELIRVLNLMPQGAQVILQKDSEGNGYSPLSQVDGNCIYQPATTWSGDVLSTAWTADEADMEDAEWQAIKRDTPTCVVLAPVN